MTTEEKMQAALGISGLTLNELATEFANSTCEVDILGDVWDSRGHWWTTEEKERFLAWLEVH